MRVESWWRVVGERVLLREEEEVLFRAVVVRVWVTVERQFTWLLLVDGEFIWRVG